MVPALRMPTGWLRTPVVWQGLLWGLILTSGLGCQNRPGNGRLFNFGRVDRVPPPPTGSLNIPQFGPVMGSPTGASMGSGLPPGALPTGGLPPQMGVSPWNSGAATGGGVPTYTAIPERAASPSGMAAVPTAGPGFDARSAPPLLPGGFDPYDTSTVPSFSVPAGGVNPLMTTSSPIAPPGAQDGFWPATPTGASGSAGNNGRSAMASGQPSQTWWDPSRFQPANVGGFATTAAIDNPMIPVTPGVYPAAGGGYSAAPVANASFAQQWQTQAAAQQARQAQQIAAWQQAQQQAQRYVQPPQGTSPGVSNYQVLAENSSSRTAENQARMGWTGGVPAANNSAYGTAPAGNRTAAGVMAAGQAPPMFSAAGQPLAAPPATAAGSGWQAGGVR